MRIRRSRLVIGTIINDRHVISRPSQTGTRQRGGLQYAASLTEWLQSLMVQEDYFRSSFLLLFGEGHPGSARVIEKHAPIRPADIVRRARVDEVDSAYGVAMRHHSSASRQIRRADLRSGSDPVLQATTGAKPQ